MAAKTEKDRAKAQQEKFQAILSNLLKDEDNKYCEDCDAKGPRWASWNLGVFLCIRCAGIHRNLGVHISRVKSVNLDSWTAEQVAMMQEMGNSRARAVYEANVQDSFRRPQTDSALEAFIRAKYEQKKYIAKEWVPPKPVVPREWLEDDKAEKKKARSKPAANISLNTVPSSSQSSSNPASSEARASAKSIPTSAAETRPAQPPAPKSKSNSDDLLGLDLSFNDASKVPQSGGGGVGQGGDLLADIFGGSQASPATQGSAGQLSAQQNGSSEPNLFESGGGGDGQGEKKSAKDSIMALYGSGGGQQQMFGVPGTDATSNGPLMPQNSTVTTPFGSVATSDLGLSTVGAGQMASSSGLILTTPSRTMANTQSGMDLLLGHPASGMMNPNTGMMNLNTGMMNPNIVMVNPNTGMMNPRAGLNGSAGMLTTSAGIMNPNAGIMNSNAGMMSPNDVMMNSGIGMMTPNPGIFSEMLTGPASGTKVPSSLSFRAKASEAGTGTGMSSSSNVAFLSSTFPASSGINQPPKLAQSMGGNPNGGLLTASAGTSGSPRCFSAHAGLMPTTKAEGAGLVSLPAVSNNNPFVYTGDQFYVPYTPSMCYYSAAGGMYMPQQQMYGAGGMQPMVQPQAGGMMGLQQGMMGMQQPQQHQTGMMFSAGGQMGGAMMGGGAQQTGMMGRPGMQQMYMQQQPQQHMNPMQQQMQFQQMQQQMGNLSLGARGQMGGMQPPQQAAVGGGTWGGSAGGAAGQTLSTNLWQ